MGRIKARTAADPADRELHKHLAAAMKELQAALGVAGRVGRDRDLPAVQKARAAEAQVKLRQAMSVVDSIGLLAGRTDRGDPDLMPEADKRPRREQPERFGDAKVT